MKIKHNETKQKQKSESDSHCENLNRKILSP